MDEFFVYVFIGTARQEARESQMRSEAIEKCLKEDGIQARKRNKFDLNLIKPLLWSNEIFKIQTEFV